MSCTADAGTSSRYRLAICCASLRSWTSSTWSRTRYRRSNREMRVGGRSMLRVMGRSTSYLEPTGLAAARMDVRALRVVMMPAFAIETVCCSYLIAVSTISKGAAKPEVTITSWSTLRVASDILSNSSIQQTPPSLRTRAPLVQPNQRVVGT
jgi:hypothetical protein